MPAPFSKTVRGVEVPTVAIGVFEVDPGEPEETVADALAAGYRHVDTAAAYGNEAEVGRALARSDAEPWVTTKVWIEEFAPDDLCPTAERTPKHLPLARIDLRLLHWPPTDPDELGPALETLQELRSEDRIREFGVSNFPAYMLRDALSITDEIFADQVEYHAKLSQRELLDVAASEDLLIEAYAPLAGSAGDTIEEPVLKEIASEHDGASPAQVALAWLAPQDRVVLLP